MLLCVILCLEGNVKKRMGIQKDKEDDDSDVLHAWTKHVSHS